MLDALPKKLTINNFDWVLAEIIQKALPLFVQFDELKSYIAMIEDDPNIGTLFKKNIKEHAESQAQEAIDDFVKVCDVIVAILQADRVKHKKLKQSQYHYLIFRLDSLTNHFHSLLSRLNNPSLRIEVAMAWKKVAEVIANENRVQVTYLRYNLKQILFRIHSSLGLSYFEQKKFVEAKNHLNYADYISKKMEFSYFDYRHFVINLNSHGQLTAFIAMPADQAIIQEREVSFYELKKILNLYLTKIAKIDGDYFLALEYFAISIAFAKKILSSPSVLIEEAKDFFNVIQEEANDLVWLRLQLLEKLNELVTFSKQYLAMSNDTSAQSDVMQLVKTSYALLMQKDDLLRKNYQIIVAMIKSNSKLNAICKINPDSVIFALKKPSIHEHLLSTFRFEVQKQSLTIVKLSVLRPSTIMRVIEQIADEDALIKQKVQPQSQLSANTNKGTILDPVSPDVVAKSKDIVSKVNNNNNKETDKEKLDEKKETFETVFGQTRHMEYLFADTDGYSEDKKEEKVEVLTCFDGRVAIDKQNFKTITTRNGDVPHHYFYYQKTAVEQEMSSSYKHLMEKFAAVAKRSKKCLSEGEEGLKHLDTPIPGELELDGKACEVSFTWEMKLKGTGKGNNSRVLAFQYPCDDGRSVAVIGSTFKANGCHDPINGKLKAPALDLLANVTDIRSPKSLQPS